MQRYGVDGCSGRGSSALPRYYLCESTSHFGGEEGRAEGRRCGVWGGRGGLPGGYYWLPAESRTGSSWLFAYLPGTLSRSRLLRRNHFLIDNSPLRFAVISPSKFCPNDYNCHRTASVGSLTRSCRFVSRRPAELSVKDATETRVPMYDGADHTAKVEAIIRQVEARPADKMLRIVKKAAVANTHNQSYKNPETVRRQRGGAHKHT